MSPQIPTQQKALLLPGKAEPFVVGTVEVPRPGPGEVLVRAEAVALNPVDWMIQETGLFVSKWPAILGWEAAGVVVEVGEGVESPAIGDKVLHPGGLEEKAATYKEYNIITSDLLAKIPSNLTFDQAASIPLTLDTAALGLYAKPGVRGGADLIPPWAPGGRGKYAGQPIFVFGGASSVGQFAIQFAKLSGFSPIITTASLKNTEYLKSLGATHVIDRKLPPSSIIASAKEITNHPIRIIYDAISDEDTQNTGYDLLPADGTIVLVRHIMIPEAKQTPGKRIADIFANPILPDRRQISADLYANVTSLFASGELKPNHVEVLPGGLAGIPAGLERLKKESISALKLIVHPQETA